MLALGLNIEYIKKYVCSRSLEIKPSQPCFSGFV